MSKWQGCVKFNSAYEKLNLFPSSIRVITSAVKGFIGGMDEAIDGFSSFVQKFENLNQFTRTQQIYCKFFIANSTWKWFSVGKKWYCESSHFKFS